MIWRTEQTGLELGLCLWRGDWRSWSDRFWRVKRKNWPAGWSWVVCWASWMTEELMEENLFNKRLWKLKTKQTFNQTMTYSSFTLSQIHWWCVCVCVCVCVINKVSKIGVCFCTNLMRCWFFSVLHSLEKLLVCLPLKHWITWCLMKQIQSIYGIIPVLFEPFLYCCEIVY